ncbi:unnamed protein product [Trichobilharzia regenti]|nr:unnamed protein product [Trichobilharzia regenti]
MASSGIISLLFFHKFACLLADFNATLKQYRDANFDSQATLFALIESRAQYNETNVIEHLLGAERSKIDECALNYEYEIAFYDFEDSAQRTTTLT